MQFNEETIQAVWNKAYPVEKVDPAAARHDECGAWIKRNRYNQRDSAFGWTIDVIDPVMGVAPNDTSNLRPLHHKNAETKKDGLLTCPVQAHGRKNALIKSASLR